MTTRQAAYTDPAAGPLRRRAQLGLSLAPRPVQGGGAQVLHVSAEGSAAHAGVIVHDIITAIDGMPVVEPRDVAQALAQARAGDAVTLEVLRDHQSLQLRGELMPLPLEPLVYASIELVAVPTPAGRLRGLWTRPLSGERGPLVFYLQTSDWGSCEHPRKPRHPETQLIDALSRVGMSTFRLERSGTGDSEGPAATDIDFHTERAGFAAGLRWLEQQPGVERHQLLLLGNSLGGMLAPLLVGDLMLGGVAGLGGVARPGGMARPGGVAELGGAARPGEVAELGGIAVLGTSARGWHADTLGSFRRQAERAGRLQEAIERELEQLTALQQLIFCEGHTPEQAYRQLPDLNQQRFHWLCGERAYDRVVTFFQQLQAIDLVAAWEQLDVPVLALHGSEDWICTAEQAQHIVATVNATHSGAARYQQLPGVDHGLTQPGAVEQVAAALQQWWAHTLKGNAATTAPPPSANTGP